MRITLKNPLQPGSYAKMVRNGKKWDIFVGDERVQQIPSTAAFKSLKRDDYMLLGLDSGECRVIRFADLHRHSDNSLLDGMTQIKEMVERTEYAGALTDHGNMYGFLEYYKAMKKAGKKAIIGFEGYMEDMDGKLSARHVILLAKNENGVKNLFKLTSESFDYFYRKPHITWEMLEKYHEDIICLSACLSGVIPTALLANREDIARKAIEKFISIFGTEDFYIEIQRHNIPDENRIRGKLVQLASEYGLKLAATTDAHYPTKDDAYAHEILLCLQTEKTITDPSHLRYNGSGYYLQTSEEMEELFSDYPEALDNTLEIADKCNTELKLGDVNLPKYTIPEQFSTPMEYLRHLASEGFQGHFAGTSHENDPIYRERYNYEINMIEKMGFESYFIIVWDFINYARNHNIYVGPGRGSAAGSIVAYCLGITDLDPIKYNLLFERFLNPERVSWPDIDSDLEYSRRPEVIQYITQKYGAENVCRIITFGTLAAKQSVKDVGRVLGKSPGYTAKLAGAIPNGKDMTISKALGESHDFRQFYDSDKDARNIIDIAMKLEGNKRHASQHACGLVISPSAVSDYLPTSMEINLETKEKNLTSQVVMTEVEELSLIKMDLLGLKTLGVIHEVIDRVQETRGKGNILKQIGSTRGEVRYQDIPLNDRKMYQMLARGETGAVFQLESEGMTKCIQQMFSDIDTLPDDRLDECFERLIAAVALYRPGPMDYIPNYIAGMEDVHNIQYLTPELESILRPTYGVIVYQEQVMQIVQKLAGYTLGRADVVRKAMGKKKKNIMDAEKQVFIYGNKEAYESGKDKSFAPGCVGNGISAEIAQQIWAQMESFASYAFNRSHAACYAFIACITAYMRCYWPEEFYAAMLNAFIENSDKTRAYLSQASACGIKLLPPDINRSYSLFMAENGNIRFGLEGIKGLKSLAPEIIMEREKGGVFEDFQDLYERMAERGSKLNKTAAAGLTYAGALDSFGLTKAQSLALFPSLEKSYKSTGKDMWSGQVCMFSKEQMKVVVPNVPPIAPQIELDKEYETLGVYLSGHPADKLCEQLESDKQAVSVRELLKGKSRKKILTGGMIRDLRCFYTKKGDYMASFMLDTADGSVPCVVFPSAMNGCVGQLQDKYVAIIQGDYNVDNDANKSQIIVEMIQDADSFTPQMDVVETFVTCKAEQDAVLDFVKQNPGKTAVRIVGSNGKAYMLNQRVNLTLSTLQYLSGDFRKSICQYY